MQVTRLYFLIHIFAHIHFGKISIADRCYAEWGISVLGIDFIKEQIDLGVYKSIWKNSKALVEEISLHNFKCVENIEAGLGGVYIFQNKKENFYSLFYSTNLKFTLSY